MRINPEEPQKRPKRSSIQQIRDSMPLFGALAVILFVVAGIQLLTIGDDATTFPHAIGLFSLGFAMLSILVTWHIVRRR